MSEIEVASRGSSSALSEQMDYARAIAAGSLLPQAYRNNPSNVLIAVGLGQSMGLSPAESLYRIDVIQGKPTASAELIAANVRKAGHKLRLRVDEQAVSATCTIIRADDPDYEHTVVRDKAWAGQMGLAEKDNYKKQPATMLGWRAVTACARMACPEALYGVAYSPDEMEDVRPAAPSRAGVASVLVEQVDPEPQAAPDPEPAPDAITSSQLKKLGALMREAGIVDRDGALAYVGDVIGREIGSRNELTKVEAGHVIDALENDLAPTAETAEAAS